MPARASLKRVSFRVVHESYTLDFQTYRYPLRIYTNHYTS